MRTETSLSSIPDKVTRITLSLCLVVLFSCSDENSAESTADRFGSGFIERDGFRLEYFRDGNGTPAVVIGSSTYYPRAFSAALRDHLDLIFADGRHFSPSYAPDESELRSLSLQTWTDDVEALRLSLGIDKWIVIGHSIHAQVALDYADRFPEAVDRLVLIAGVPYAGGDIEQDLNELWDSQASERRKAQHEVNIQGLEDKLAATPAERQFVVNYVAQAALFWADPAYDSTPMWDGVQTSPAWEKLVQLVPERPEVKMKIENLEVPTLVVAGKHDYGVPYKAWEALVADNPAISYVLMEQDSHNPQTEAAERFDPVLLEWLKL